MRQRTTHAKHTVRILLMANTVATHLHAFAPKIQFEQPQRIQTNICLREKNQITMPSWQAELSGHSFMFEMLLNFHYLIRVLQNVQYLKHVDNLYLCVSKDLRLIIYVPFLVHRNVTNLNFLLFNEKIS